MIAIYLPLAVSEEVLRRCHDLPDIALQIRAQLTLERLLPTQARPVLALWYPDSQHHELIFDERLAHAIWSAHVALVKEKQRA